MSRMEEGEPLQDLSNRNTRACPQFGSISLANGSRDETLTIEENDPLEPRGPLNEASVFSLIVNKMIGTGIFTAPATVYAASGSKPITLALFIVGFLHTLVSTWLYLKYADLLPHTGGELVYLDEMSAHSGRDSENSKTPTGTTRRGRFVDGIRKFMGDGLLLYVVYVFIFVVLFNSGTNALQFSRMVLMTVHAEEIIPSNEDKVGSYAFTGDLLRFIGAIVLMLICLIHFFSPWAGRAANNFFAFIKILFLLALITIGGVAAVRKRQSSDPPEGWNLNRNDQPWQGCLLAFLNVLFSFEGWENATFVTSEIEPKILRRGFIKAVVTVGVLYIAIVAAFLDAVPFEDLADKEYPKSLFKTFFPPILADGRDNRKRALQAWGVIGALSALGSLNSIIYTFSRVKQAIGHAEVLPWSFFWKKDHIVKNKNNSDSIERSPMGGLVLHCIMTLIMIAATAAIPDTMDSVFFPGNLQTFAHTIVLTLLSVLFFRLPARESALSKSSDEEPLNSNSTLYLLGMVVVMAIYTLVNIFVVIMNTISDTPVFAKENNEDFRAFSYASWTLPVVCFACIGLSVLYYLMVFGRATWIYPSTGSGPGTPGVLAGVTWLSWMNLPRYAHITRVEIRKDNEYNGSLERVARFGRRWRVRWILDLTRREPGAPGRGEQSTAATEQSNAEYTTFSFWYWFFGGRRWLEKISTRERFDGWWRLSRRPR